jgi:aminopeptidase N
MIAPVLAGEDARDVHSFAEPAIARVTHVDLDLSADFTSRVLSGTAGLDVIAAGSDAVLTLDTRALQVEAVTDGAGAPLAWEWGVAPDQADPILGAPLRIELGKARRVLVHYRTSPDAAALQWLGPAQTSGKQHPFLLSQGQAVLTRSWVPTQDSPGIRQTWTARIVAPQALTVVMSAEALGGEAAGDAARAWRFRMALPVAPYLIAIAIGELQFRELGPRTGVYAEPAVIDAAATEFADLEAMMRATESLYGAYRWGRYDLLVLPPSFPFGGMENPRLSFITPTLIAGDKSLVDVVAHELAHSWSGNLVSNATWSDFWLNEGFTTYIERRIIEAVYGARFAAMLADKGWEDLQSDLAGLDAADTRLHLALAGRDPDDAMTDIAYEKGAHFLATVESIVGRERLDAWLRAYFDRHAFQPQTSAGMLADLREHLLQGDAGLEARIDPDAWVYGTGLPANAVQTRSESFQAVDAAAVAFDRDGASPDVAGWSSSERVRFLNQLERKQSVQRIRSLVSLLALESQHNSEVRFAWLRLAIANRYAPAVPQLEEFLVTVGRRKFVRPLFGDLMEQGEWGSRQAQRIYARARPGYHSVTRDSVDEIVPLPAGEG